MFIIPYTVINWSVGKKTANEVKNHSFCGFSGKPSEVKPCVLNRKLLQIHADILSGYPKANTGNENYKQNNERGQVSVLHSRYWQLLPLICQYQTAGRHIHSIIYTRQAGSSFCGIKSVELPFRIRLVFANA